MFPGQDAPVTATGGTAGLLTTEAAATGGTVSYTLHRRQPGTYLYESGSDVAKQVEMGLYGALVVRPSAGADFAYDAPRPQFDPAREYLLLLSEIDPDLHHAVETGGTYDFNALHNRYFTINGREFPDTIQDNGSALLPNQPYGALVRIQPNTAPNTRPALIRMINAGAGQPPVPPARQPHPPDRPGRPAAPARRRRHDRALRRDDRLRADRGLPARWDDHGPTGTRPTNPLRCRSRTTAT